MINGMILFDSSIWIDYIKSQRNPKSDLLRNNLLLSTGNVIICPPIIQEVLQGVNFEKQFHYLKEIFSTIDRLDIDAYQMSISAAEIYFTLRKKGITIRKANDCLIAAYALEFDIPLVHNDKDFDAIATAFPLKIYHPKEL